jgi:hypothetical protein
MELSEEEPTPRPIFGQIRLSASDGYQSWANLQRDSSMRQRVMASSIRAWQVRACALHILHSLVDGSARVRTQISNIP